MFAKLIFFSFYTFYFPLGYVVCGSDFFSRSFALKGLNYAAYQ